MKKILSLLILCVTCTYAYASNDAFDGITANEQNYILPWYYSKKPQDKNNMNGEVSFQLSLAYPLWEKIGGSNLSWMVSYTQKSFWQAYSNSAFFRETNYEPSMYLQYNLGKTVTFASGLVHQSNGRGGEYERSWNRVFVNLQYLNDYFMIRLTPWVRVDSVMGMHDYNDDITSFLGHGKITIALKLSKNIELSTVFRNNIESNFKRGYVESSLSFPIFKNIKGFLLANTGYGSSLISYNQNKRWIQ